MPKGIKWFDTAWKVLLKQIATFSFVVFFIPGLFTDLKAQQTAVYFEPEATHRKAFELFEQKNYGSAKELFESIINEANHGKNEILMAEKAAFYSACCAYHLQEEDALQRFYKFTDDYPASQWLNQSRFYIGNLEFENKKYKNALQSYTNLNPIGFSDSENTEYLFKTGYCHYKLDDPDKAKNNFLPVMQSGSDYAPDAVFYYSLISFQQNIFDEALGGFQSLLNQEKYSEQATSYIIQIHYHDRNYEKVTEMAPLAEPVLSAKSDYQIYFILGDSFLKTGKLSEAQPFLKNYITKNGSKTSREEFYTYAYTLYRLKQYGEAIPYFQKSTSKQDSLAQLAYYHLGDCYYQTNQKNFAINAFESASFIKSDTDLATESFFNFANLSLETGLIPHQQIIDRLQRFIADNPESDRVSEAKSLIVNILLISKNYQEAIEIIESSESTSAKLREIYPQLLYLRGIELFNQNKFTEAEMALRKASKTGNANNSEINFWLGECCFRLSKLTEAESLFKTVANSKNAQSSKICSMSIYNLGHVSMKQKKYSEAITWFKKYTELKSDTDADLLHDSYLRLGDLFFLDKKYQTSLSNYDKALGLTSIKNDYALYQKALCLGAMGSYSEKVSTLELFLQKYPSSTLADDACFETGQTYLLLNRDKESVRFFEKLVNTFPNSQYGSKALLKSGLVYYSLSQFELAIESLKKVISVFPGSQESNEALEILSNIYLDLNKVSEYTSYLKTLKNVNITETEQASLTYTAAENQYIKENYKSALEGFTNYIQQFPNGTQIENAWFYMAECLFKTNYKPESAKAFLYFLDKPSGKLTDAALANAGNIYMNLQKFDSAIIVFERLELVSTNEKSLTEALKGQVYAAYALADYSKTLVATEKLSKLSGVSAETRTDVFLIRGRSALVLKQNQVAEDAFIKVSSAGTPAQSAEAQYSLAYIKFTNGLLKEAENMIYDLVKKYSSAEEWKARSFILLSDILVKQENYFQASHTLQSIIDNYPEKEIVDLAKEKLIRIKELEKQSSQ